MPLPDVSTGWHDTYFAGRRASGQYQTRLKIVDPFLSDSIFASNSMIIPVVGGTSFADAGQSPRWSAEVTIDGRQLPDGLLEVLPFTGAVTITDRWVDPVSGITHNVDVFDGYVDEAHVDRPDQTVTLRLLGWEGRIREDVIKTTRKVTGTDTVRNTIKWLIERTLPTAGILYGPGLDTTTTVGDGYTLAPGDDPLQAILDLANSIGAECYSSPGRFVSPLNELGPRLFILQPVAGLDDWPNVENLVTPETVLLRSKEQNRRAPNTTRIRFEPSQPTKAKPARTGAAEVTTGVQDPDTMGRFTEFQRRTAYRTSGQATTAAERLLRQRSRRSRSVSWEQVPAPWTEPGDTCPVRLKDLESYPDAETESLLVNRLELPLTGGRPMTVIARATVYTGG